MRESNLFSRLDQEINPNEVYTFQTSMSFIKKLQNNFTGEWNLVTKKWKMCKNAAKIVQKMDSRISSLFFKLG